MPPIPPFRGTSIPTIEKSVAAAKFRVENHVVYNKFPYSKQIDPFKKLFRKSSANVRLVSIMESEN